MGKPPVETCFEIPNDPKPPITKIVVQDFYTIIDWLMMMVVQTQSDLQNSFSPPKFLNEPWLSRIFPFSNTMKENCSFPSCVCGVNTQQQKNRLNGLFHET